MKSKHFQKEKALVVGNGESRKRIDLNLFNRDKWEIYGCNALYREFSPDHLIILDKGMREEFESEGRSFYGMSKYIYFVEDIAEYEPMMSAGCMAIQVAMRHHKEIDIIGFDLETRDGLINNVYKDSPHYMPNHKPSGGFIIDQYNLKVICNRFDGGTITRVADNIPFELDKYMKHVTIEEYVSKLFANNIQEHMRKTYAT